MTRRAARQGDPEPRHQVSLLGPATPSDHLTPEGTDRNPCAWRGETPLATRSHWKALPRPELRPSAQQGAASGTALRRQGVTAQVGAHQENSREQKFASCSGLGFSSGDTGCILPAWTDAGRGRGVGAAGATRSCEARPPVPLMEAVGEPHSTGHGTQAPSFTNWAANSTKGRALSPGPHPEEGRAGCSRNTPQLW